jgi:hypothetical protein
VQVLMTVVLWMAECSPLLSLRNICSVIYIDTLNKGHLSMAGIYFEILKLIFLVKLQYAVLTIIE